MESLLHKFYAASISIGLDGSMMVASTKVRVLLWGTIFCISASICLITWLLMRKKYTGKFAIACFILTLVIPVMVIPSVRKEYIHVSPTAITVESGEWYMPSKTVSPMSNIKNIYEIDAAGIIPGNLIGDPNINWHFTWIDGNSEIVELNEFFNAHRMVIAYYYKDRGYWLERLEDQITPTL
jgi:hypothetical protein